jgi:hypothetical protein
MVAIHALSASDFIIYSGNYLDRNNESPCLDIWHRAAVSADVLVLFPR